MKENYMTRDYNVVFKFSVYVGKQSRTTYRVIRTLDDRFLIQEYGTHSHTWYYTFLDCVYFRSMEELFRSKEFRQLFTQI